MTSGDSESLDCLALLIEQGQTDLIPHVYEHIIVPISELICDSFCEFPDLRKSFFGLVRVLLASPSLVDNSVFTELFGHLFYGLRHPQTEIAELCLNGIMGILDLLNSHSSIEFVNDFYQTFYPDIISNILSAVLDGTHTALFIPLTQVIHHLLDIVSVGRIEFITLEELAELLFEKLHAILPHMNAEELSLVGFDLVRGTMDCSSVRTVLSNLIIASKKVDPDIYEIRDLTG